MVAARGDRSAVAGWASVTKPLVALAVLDAESQGELDLDEPAGPPGSTVRHLLAHASGLAPERNEVLSRPGRRRTYSNAGFEVLGEFLAERTRVSWAEAVIDRVAGPLSMTSVTVRPGTPAAWGARGSLDDLLALGGELLRPRHFGLDLIRAASSVEFPGLRGVVPGVGRYEHCDWGLGFELKGDKVPHWTASSGSRRTFGHFGRSGTFLWVDPDAGVACASVGGPQFGKWALQAWPSFSDAVLATWGTKAEAVRA